MFFGTAPKRLFLLKLYSGRIFALNKDLPQYYNNNSPFAAEKTNICLT